MNQLLERIDKRAAAIAAVLFLAAFVYRLLGIGWGLPSEDRWASYHPDEPVNMAYANQIDPLRGDLTPGFYNYGTLFLTASHFAGKIGAQYFGGSDSQDEAVRARAAERGALLGVRLLSALAGAGMASLAFLLLFGRVHDFGAILAGVILASAPGLTVHSRFATVDILAAFLALLSVYWAMRLAPLGEEEPLDEKTLLKFSLYAGIAAGLSAACKYNGILVLIVLGVILAMQYKGRWMKPLGAAVAASVVVFLVGVPGILLETNAFVRDFTYELAHTSSGHGTVFLATAPGAIFHFGNLWEALGLLLILLGLGGLMRAASRKHVWAWGLLAFAVVYYLLIARAEVKFLRYVFPLLPVLAVGAGWLAGRAHVHPANWGKGLVAVIILGIGGVGGGGVMRSFTETAWMAGSDPRDEAAAWLKEQAASGKSVGVVADPWFWMPPLYPQATLPLLVPFASRNEFRLASPIQVAQFIPENPDERFDWDTRLITDLKPDYVVATSFQVDDYQRIASGRRGTDLEKLFAARYQEFITKLKDEYEEERIFGGGAPTVHDMKYIRPSVYIWKRKAASSGSSASSSTGSPSTAASAPTP